LRRVAEMADMLPYCNFSEQETAGALRADLVVRLPGGSGLSSTPRPARAYRAASEAADEPTREARLAEHALKVRGHVDALGAKNYWEQFQPARSSWSCSSRRSFSHGGAAFRSHAHGSRADPARSARHPTT